jgi:hypothetical protein
MKYILGILLVLVISMITYGFYIKNSGDATGEIIIGISVLIIAFILMPLFIWKRYKNKNIKDFTFENYKKDLDEHIRKENS